MSFVLVLKERKEEHKLWQEGKWRWLGGTGVREKHQNILYENMFSVKSQ